MSDTAIPGLSARNYTIVLGVLGGLPVLYMGYRHMFVEGLTDHERKSILGVAAASGLLLVAGQFGWDTSWLTLEGLSQKVETYMESRL